ALELRIGLADRDSDRDRIDRAPADRERLGIFFDVVRDDGRVAEICVDLVGLERVRSIGVLREGDDLDRLLALALKLLALGVEVILVRRSRFDRGGLPGEARD